MSSQAATAKISRGPKGGYTEPSLSKLEQCCAIHRAKAGLCAILETSMADVEIEVAHREFLMPPKPIHTLVKKLMPLSAFCCSYCLGD
jgi:hypothetical protein